MYARLGQIFWGLLLVIVDLKVSDIDLLPDFIGYIIVAIGARGLIEVSDRFRTVRNLSWILATLSLASWFLPRDTWLVLELVNTAFDCAMIWFLLGGVMDISSAKNRFDLVEQASNRRIAYLTLTCIVALVGLVLRGSHVGADWLVVLVVVSMLILMVMILRLIYRVRHEIAISDA